MITDREPRLTALGPNERGPNEPERILLVHERYRIAGGEEAVVEAEAALLRRHGHVVARLELDNTDIPARPSVLARLRLAAGTVWSSAGARAVAAAASRSRPDLVHVHNTFPLLSPSVYSACRRARLPIVQTLHNYRLVCPAATLFRDGRVCEDCLDRGVPWPALVHACYRSSRIETAPVAAMLAVHRMRGTWRRDVDLFLALTEFARRKMIEGGLPAERVIVKPNFVDPDPGPGDGPGEGFVFAGRLSPEKGLATLIAAWERLQPGPVCRIVGDGPEAGRVRSAADRLGGLRPLGRRPPTEVLSELRGARALVLPSGCYEGLPMVLLEAFATARPVIGSRLGSIETLIDHGRTGLLFDQADPADLARAIAWAHEHPGEMAEMGRQARSEFLARYTAEANYRQLIAAYRRAIARSALPARPA